MSNSGNNNRIRLGFLAAVELKDRGYVGGLLMTNHHGRPLEFQCTTPVKPNATQEILYGPTLKPWLMGELLGKTLIKRSQIKPNLVLVQRQEMLALRDHISIPVVRCVQSESTSTDSIPLICHREFAGDRAVAAKLLKSMGDAADLAEPFDRVSEALNETLRAAA